MGIAKERKKFENELVKQGYTNYSNNPQMYDEHSFSRKIGPCTLSANVFDHHGARQWNVTFYWRLKIGSEMPDVAPDILSGSNYDIKEFNKAQARVIDETQRNLIPAIRKQLKLPKELTDLVEKK